MKSGGVTLVVMAIWKSCRLLKRPCRGALVPGEAWLEGKRGYKNIFLLET